MNNLPVYILYYPNAELISEKGLQFARALGSDRVFLLYITVYKKLSVSEPKSCKMKIPSPYFRIFGRWLVSLSTGRTHCVLHSVYVLRL